MGLNDLRIYFDSCLAIYLVEEHSLYAPKLETALANYSHAKVCISPLTEMECLVIPFRLQNKLLIRKFEDWFKQGEVLTVDAEIYRNAARLRADFPSLKTPDALHLATAHYHHCDELWTNDDRLNKIAPALVKNIL